MQYDQIEQLIGRDTGRNIHKLVHEVSGRLEKTVNALVGCKNVRIVTGFFIPKAVGGGAAETDGPPGAVILAAILRSHGVTVKLVTDYRCHKTLLAAAQCLDFEESDVELIRERTDIQPTIERWQKEKVDGLIAVERPAIGFDNIMRNMNGEPVQMYHLDLAPLFKCVTWISFGIGDGGNEIGMGNIPWPVIENAVKYGSKIASSVKTDHLIVSGVSNWGAIALACCWARKMDLGLDVRVADLHTQLVRAMVDAGACDGSTLQKAYSVDGLSLTQHEAILNELQNLVEGD